MHNRDETQSLAGVALLVRIVEAGSISAAARSLGLPKSTVSRRLTALETDLGRALVRRSTRALTLTDAGQRLFDTAGPGIRTAWLAAEAVLDEGNEIAGLVRISATAAYARHRLLPALCRFLTLHPQVRLDLVVDEHRVSVVPDGIDIAIRLGPLSDAALLARRIDSVQRLLVAAPSYLEAHGAPAAPADLVDHNAVVTSPDLVQRTFEDGTSLRVGWRMSAGTMELAYDATLGGFGIALLPDFLVSQSLSDGRLVEVLGAFREAPVAVSALFPEATRASPAARALVDHLGT